MTGLVGPARELGGDAPKALARAFAMMAWPAFAVLVVTGFWNVSAVGYASQSSTWKAVLMVKVLVVVVAGVAAFLHQRATTKLPAGPVGVRGRHRQRRRAGDGRLPGRLTDQPGNRPREPPANRPEGPATTPGAHGAGPPGVVPGPIGSNLVCSAPPRGPG